MNEASVILCVWSLERGQNVGFAFGLEEVAPPFRQAYYKFWAAPVPQDYKKKRPRDY